MKEKNNEVIIPTILNSLTVSKESEKKYHYDVKNNVNISFFNNAYIPAVKLPENEVYMKSIGTKAED